MKRKLASWICLLAVLLTAASPALAYSKEDHWKDIKIVLFGDANWGNSLSKIKDKTKKEKKMADSFDILKFACQFCIDQFSGGEKDIKDNSGQMDVVWRKTLEDIKKLGVKGLPSYDKLKLIASANTHHIYTHLGWDYKYTDDEKNKHWTKNWGRRRKLLLLSVEKVFNFNGSNWIDPILPFTGRAKGFAKFLYYIHLLGDHIAGEKGENLMPLASTREDSIIKEIKETFPYIFPSAKKEDYAQLTNELDTAARNIQTLVNSEEESIDEYKEAAQNVRDILKKYVPGLLKNEDYFAKVFYPNN